MAVPEEEQTSRLYRGRALGSSGPAASAHVERLELLVARGAVAIADGEEHAALAARSADVLIGNRADELLHDCFRGRRLESHDQVGRALAAIGVERADDGAVQLHLVGRVDDE